MKIIRLFPAADPAAPCRSVILPDTTLLIRQRPFFVPDFAERTAVRLCLAVRITRLGRSIHERFASRYYDEAHVGLGAHFFAEDLLERLYSEGLPWVEAMAFDDCLALTEADRSCRPTEGGRIGLGVGESELQLTPDFDALLRLVDREIARFSCFYTLRQGDVVLLPFDLVPLYVDIDDRLTLTVDDAPVLAFNIK